MFNNVLRKKTIAALFLVIVALVSCERQKEEKTPPVSKEKTQPVAAEILPGFLVSTEELADLSGQQNVVIIDARDEEEYRKLHIPGSINIPKETFREPEDLDYKSDNGFLTSPEKAAMVFGDSGIDENTRVIVYGTNAFPNASIPFVILKQYGHDKVQVMQGFQVKPKEEMVATMDWVMDNAEEIVVIDMRSFEEYTGFNTAGNPRGGHVSGAYPVEWKELAGKTTVKSPEDMIEALKSNGVPLDKNKAYVTYCNWGIGRGTSGFMYLTMLGFKNVRVYGGSMEEWSDDPDFPVSTYELGILE
jgi:thiosulfate/3-mercaptopyruvate sulfurtransferase